jgi:tetratricopeptide (TPR) repeat protein
LRDDMTMTKNSRIGHWMRQSAPRAARIHGMTRPADLFVTARQSLSRFAARRATRLEIRRPKAAERWLRVSCRLAPRFDFVHRDLCAHYRRLEDRLAAAAVAQEAVRRFSTSADAWMLLGECYLAAFRPHEALVAFENVLTIEERVDAALAVGELYSRDGDHKTAGARYARAYAAGAGPKALKLNARELQAAGDARAAAEARAMWERETGKRWED